MPRGAEDPAEAGRRPSRRHPIPHALANSHDLFGILLRNAGRSSEAEAEYREALALRQKLFDDHPAIPQFQRDLADSLLSIGWQLSQAGKTVEAIGHYTREEVIRSKLIEAGSTIPEDKDSLANCQINMADALRRSGRLDEALAACERSLAVASPWSSASRCPILPHVPRRDVPASRSSATRYGRSGRSRRAPGGVRIASYDGGNQFRDDEDTFLMACCHAGLAGIAGRPGSGVSAGEGADQAEAAMAVLRRAVAMGYRNPNAYRTESALDPLRNRPDFRDLMMDLVFPTEPFAQ